MQINQNVTTSGPEVKRAKLTYETQPAKEITILFRDGGSRDLSYMAEHSGYDEVRASYDMKLGIFQVIYYTKGIGRERMDYQLDIIQSVGVEYD